MNHNKLETSSDYFDDVLIIVPYDEGVNVKINKPMKEALQRTAAKAGYTMSDLVRHLIIHHMGEVYPDYNELYKYFYDRELKTLRSQQKGENE